MIRQFSIENEIGEFMNLTNTDDLFLSSPYGLGVSFDTNYYPLGGDFFATVKYETKQQQIGGVLQIRNRENSAYGRYREVMTWLMRAQQLRFKYTTDNENYYFRDVEFISVDKTELSTGYLNCPIRFASLTPWYLPSFRTLTIDTEPEPDNPKRYTYRYPYRYVRSRPTGGVDFIAGGELYSGFIGLFNGVLVDPKLTVKDVTDNNKTLGVVDLAGVSVAEGSVLKISAVANQRGVWLDGVDMVSRMELYQGTPAFPTLPSGHEIIIQMENSSGGSKGGSIQLYEYWATR